VRRDARETTACAFVRDGARVGEQQTTVGACLSLTRDPLPVTG
jgi:hypothetical protein